MMLTSTFSGTAATIFRAEYSGAMQFTVMPFLAFSCASALVKPMMPAFSRIIRLSHLALLAIDGRDVDDAAVISVAHAIDDRLGHIEHAVQIDPYNLAPLLWRHPVQHGVARYVSLLTTIEIGPSADSKRFRPAAQAS